MEIDQGDVVLCTFYFSDVKQSKRRPVLVFKDNLPHDDFIAIPISSKIQKLYQDEIVIDPLDFLEGNLPVQSKLMIRKTFVVSKSVIIKKYGTLSFNACQNFHRMFCRYFGC